MTNEKQPRKASGLLFFIFNVLAAVCTFKALSEPPYIFAAMGFTFIACISRAYQGGIINEAMAILRIAGSFALAWFLAEHAGKALGLPGFLATITGFYLTLFVGFIVSGQLILWLNAGSNPSIPEKLLGGIVGGLEGVLVAWILLIGVCALPNSKMAGYYPQLFAQFTGPVEKMLAPVMPEQANSAVQVMKSAQRIANNFNPEKVDRQALQEILTPIAEMPEIAAIQQDQGIRDLVEKKDFMALINHPALRTLLESKDLQEKLKSLDLQKLERALSPRP